MMRNLSTKLVLLLVVAALLPLCVFGVLAIRSAREAAFQAIEQGYLPVAERAAAQINDYVINSEAILRALAQHLGQTDLQPWQKERVIRNYVVSFDEYREIYLTDRDGKQIATSQLGNKLESRANDPAFQAAIEGMVYRSPVFLSKNLTPSIIIALPITSLGQVQGVVTGEVNLLSMWHLVDSIRLGQEGYAFVVSESGQLLAHGRGAEKPKVLQEVNLSGVGIVKDVLAGQPGVAVYQGERADGVVEMVGVSAPISSLGWGLIIEQPTYEAYAQARLMTVELIGLIGFFIIFMIVIGMMGGRRQVVAPIQELLKATTRISGGNLTEKVTISTGDEFQTLGESFNHMSSRLVELQDQIRRDERAVVFGRIAAGLAHDLRHPIRNIENNSRLLMRKYEDPVYREQFSRIVSREFTNVNRFLDDLRDLTHPIPMTVIPLDIAHLLSEVTEALQEEAGGRQSEVMLEGQPGACYVLADRFAISRVFNNLIRNGLEAISNGGKISISIN